MPAKRTKSGGRPLGGRKTTSKEERIKLLYQLGVEIDTICARCKTNRNYVEEVLNIPQKAPVKKKIPTKDQLSNMEMQQIVFSMREKLYQKDYIAVRNEAHSYVPYITDIKYRKEIAALEKEAMISLHIQAAQKHGKDAKEVAEELGLRVSDVIDRMGIKVIREDGSVYYKTRREKWQERYEDEER